MNKLELIRLADNRLEKLPDWIMTHPTLAWVALAANPATEPWSEVSPGLVEISWDPIVWHTESKKAKEASVKLFPT